MPRLAASSELSGNCQRTGGHPSQAMISTGSLVAAISRTSRCPLLSCRSDRSLHRQRPFQRRGNHAAIPWSPVYADGPARGTAARLGLGQFVEHFVGNGVINLAAPAKTARRGRKQGNKRRSSCAVAASNARNPFTLVPYTRENCSRDLSLMSRSARTPAPCTIPRMVPNSRRISAISAETAAASRMSTERYIARPPACATFAKSFLEFTTSGDGSVSSLNLPGVEFFRQYAQGWPVLSGFHPVTMPAIPVLSEVPGCVPVEPASACRPLPAQRMLLPSPRARSGDYDNIPGVQRCGADCGSFGRSIVFRVVLPACVRPTSKGPSSKSSLATASASAAQSLNCQVSIALHDTPLHSWQRSLPDRQDAGERVVRAVSVPQPNEPSWWKLLQTWRRRFLRTCAGQLLNFSGA